MIPSQQKPFNLIGEFLEVLHQGTPTQDKALAGLSSVLSVALTLSDIATFIGAIVGLATFFHILIRIKIALVDLKIRRKESHKDGKD